MKRAGPCGRSTPKTPTALELLGKHLGIFTDKIRAEVSGPDGGPMASEIVVRFVEPDGEQSGEAGDGR